MTSLSSVAAAYVPEQPIAMTFFSTGCAAPAESPLNLAERAPLRAMKQFIADDGPQPSIAQKSKQRLGLDRRNDIVIENLPLVKALAARVLKSVRPGVELCDLEHAGVLGLVDAAAKYDDSKGVPFACYAKHRIRGAILDSLRQLDPVSRDTRRRCKKVDSATTELRSALGRQPVEEEVAEKLQMDVESYRQMMIGMRYTGAISASTPLGDDENSSTRDFPTDIAARPDSIYAANQLRELLGTALKILPTRYQTVLKLYYQQDMTMKEIGETLKVNESRVSQIHKIALTRMAVAMRHSGIKSSRAALYQ